MPIYLLFCRLALLGLLSLAALAARAQAPLTSGQIRRWQHLDLQADGVPGISADRAYRQLPRARRRATVIIMLTTTMDARDLSRLEELNIAGLVSKLLTKGKIGSILQLHFQRQLPDGA